MVEAGDEDEETTELRSIFAKAYDILEMTAISTTRAEIVSLFQAGHQISYRLLQLRALLEREVGLAIACQDG